jgi:hypothetical protein
MYIPTNLKRWIDPPHYVGARWPDYFSSGVGRTRDSKPLEESNFRCMLRALGGESPTVIVVRESHWLCGWIEWIAIHESDETALQTADKIAGELKDYPVIDEDDFSDVEYQQVVDWWSGEPLRYRIRLCADEGCSIFAARRQFNPPEDVFNALRENL